MKKFKFSSIIVLTIILTLGLTISLNYVFAAMFQSTVTGIQIGNTTLTESNASDNLIYGIFNDTGSNGSFMLLQEYVSPNYVDRFRIDHTGKITTSGDVCGNGICLSTVGGAMPGGSSGQTLRHNGTTWEATSAIQVYNTTGFVGINTTSDPGVNLGVNGDVNVFGLSVIANNATNRFVKADFDETNNFLTFGMWIPPASWSGNILVLKNGGNVGLGTTRPQGKLSVSFNNDDQLAFYSSGDNNLSIQTLLDTQNLSGYGTYGGGNNILALQPLVGYVGIGTNVPSEKLHINGGNLRVSNDGDTKLTLLPISGVANNRESIINFWSTFDNFPGDLGTRLAARIQAGFDAGTWGTEYMAFGVGGAGDVANPPTEMMRLKADGSVLIGYYNTNGSTLSIKQATANSVALNIDDGTSWLRFVPNLGVQGFNQLSQAGDAGLIFSNGVVGTGNLVIAPWSSGTASGIKIDANGNVGIGEPNPTNALTVLVSGNNYDDYHKGIRLELSNDNLYFYRPSENVFAIDARRDGETTPTPLVLNPSASGGNGYVGIGTTNPTPIWM